MKKIKTKHYLIIYIIMYTVLGIIFCSLTTQQPIGEFDDYTLMTASLLNESNFTISSEDIEYAKKIFPELSNGYDLYTNLSGYVASNGEYIAWYPPMYSLICVPMVQILLILDLPAIYGFAYTNVILVCLLLLVVYFCLNVDIKKKVLLIIALSINPIIFYFTWQSCEVFMYVFLGISILAWINKYYKISGVLLSVAGALNPTVMCVGLFMILDYFCELFLENKGIGLRERCIKILYQWKSILLYASCFLFALVPYAYNYYYSGNISLPASYSMTSNPNAPSDTNVFLYFLSYLFDWNFGLLPYYSFFLVLFITFGIIAIIKKHRKYLMISLSLFFTIFAYSLMWHINCGMSGISRYNAWSSVIMVIAVIFFYDELLVKKVAKNICISLQVLSIIVTLCIIITFGPMRASNTDYKQMTPVAKFILNNFPNLYNPIPTIFNIRVNGLDGVYRYETPVIYLDEEDYVRKILVSSKDIDFFLENISGNKEDCLWLEERLSNVYTEEYISVPKKYELQICSSYMLGEDILFASKNRNADTYVKKGLSANEGSHAWTDGEELVLNFKLENDVQYKYYHACFEVLGAFNGQQYVIIYVNDKKVKQDIISEATNLEFDFELGDTNEVYIKLLFPDAISPMELNQSIDDRMLGLALWKANIIGINE